MYAYIGRDPLPFINFLLKTKGAPRRSAHNIKGTDPKGVPAKTAPRNNSGRRFIK